MVQRVKIILEDDLTGGPADETVRFSLDNNSYEIDLSTENAERFRALVADYVAVARRNTSAARVSRRGSAGAKTQDTAQIRTWATENGYTVSSRGRIQGDIIDAYRKAHGQA